MKSQLKTLYNNNPIYYNVWSWLWIMSDSKFCISFTYAELCARFNIPKSTLRRIIAYSKEWNKEKMFVEITNEYTKVNICFHPRGKKLNLIVSKDELFIEEMYDYLVEYYKEQDFEYSNINTHKKYVKPIINKIKKAISNKGLEVNEEAIKNTFIYFFKNMPDWWRKNSFELKSIDKNFNKILHQIKTHKKNDKFANTYQATKSIDYSGLTKK